MGTIRSMLIVAWPSDQNFDSVWKASQGLGIFEVVIVAPPGAIEVFTKLSPTYCIVLGCDVTSEKMDENIRIFEQLRTFARTMLSAPPMFFGSTCVAAGITSDSDGENLQPWLEVPCTRETLAHAIKWQKQPRD